MLFTSVSYFLFLPAVFALYYLLPGKFKSFFLLLASYFFYMSWLPVYGMLLAALTISNYALGLLIDRFRTSARPLLCAGIALNLGTLCFYKYTLFLLTNWNG